MSISLVMVCNEDMPRSDVLKMPFGKAKWLKGYDMEFLTSRLLVKMGVRLVVTESLLPSDWLQTYTK